MNKLLLLLTFCFSCLTLTAQSQTSALIPYPRQISRPAGKPFLLKDGLTRLYTNAPSLHFAARQLQDMLADEMQIELSAATTVKQADIRLLINTDLQGQEHYRLHADARGLCIEGATPQAVFYGVMTLHQLLLGDVCATARRQISPVTIDDAPRFPYRALMLDPARHFLSVRDVKFYIDQMVRYKYNVLQLHLTDDQGWRVEIHGYPALASEEHYTQEELKDLVAYAAERHVEIVPELDIPGHTVAMLAAFPELGCTVSDTVPKVPGKTFDLMLCAGVEKTYEVYGRIFHELASVFPSPRIHLGGDESVIDRNWARCERCRKLMQQYGYTEARELMVPFFDRMLALIRREGKHPVLWCELDRAYPPAHEYLFPYPQDVTLVTWRSGLTPKCIELTARHGHPLIMAPGEYTYFDYPQLKGDLPEFNNWGMPVTTLEQTYALDPGYGLPEEEQQHILGVMGTLWGEAMPDINRVTYMTYPRALALAEAGWSPMAQRDWTSFKQRLYPNLLYLMKQGVSVRVPFEIVPRP